MKGETGEESTSTQSAGSCYWDFPLIFRKRSSIKMLLAILESFFYGKRKNGD
jgi:hypothetical protein